MVQQISLRARLTYNNNQVQVHNRGHAKAGSRETAQGSPVATWRSYALPCLQGFELQKASRLLAFSESIFLLHDIIRKAGRYPTAYAKPARPADIAAIDAIVRGILAPRRHNT